MSNALKAPGSSQAENQVGQQESTANRATDLLNMWAPYAQHQLQFQTGLEGLRQHLINQQLNLSNPANFAGEAQTFGNQARSLGADNARYAAAMYGPNSGAAIGAGIHGLNQANDAQNHFLGQLYNPMNLSQMYHGGLNSIQGAGPNYSTLGQLAGVVYGRPQVPVGPSPLGSIASLGGSIFGGPTGGAAGSALFGGGGSPGGYSMWNPLGNSIPGAGWNLTGFVPGG